MGLRSLIEVLKKLILMGKTSGQRFSKELWQDIESRRRYVRSIIKNPLYKGMSKSEAESIFGIDESDDLYPNRWAYFVCIQGRKEYMLALYFEDDVLIDIRQEYSYID